MPFDELLSVGRNPRTPYVIYNSLLNGDVTLTAGTTLDTLSVNITTLPVQTIGINVSANITTTVIAGFLADGLRLEYYLNGELIAAYALENVFALAGIYQTTVGEYLYLNRELWGMSAVLEVRLRTDSAVVNGTILAKINSNLNFILK